MQRDRNMAAPKYKQIFKVYRGSMLITSLSHILEIVCSHVLAMCVQAFEIYVNGQ